MYLLTTIIFYSSVTFRQGYVSHDIEQFANKAQCHEAAQIQRTLLKDARIKTDKLVIRCDKVGK